MRTNWAPRLEPIRRVMWFIVWTTIKLYVTQLKWSVIVQSHDLFLTQYLEPFTQRMQSRPDSKDTRHFISPVKSVHVCVWARSTSLCNLFFFCSNLTPIAPCQATRRKVNIMVKASLSFSQIHREEHSHSEPVFGESSISSTVKFALCTYVARWPNLLSLHDRPEPAFRHISLHDAPAKLTQTRQKHTWQRAANYPTIS